MEELPPILSQIGPSPRHARYNRRWHVYHLRITIVEVRLMNNHKPSTPRLRAGSATAKFRENAICCTALAPFMGQERADDNPKHLSYPLWGAMASVTFPKLGRFCGISTGYKGSKVPNPKSPLSKFFVAPASVRPRSERRRATFRRLGRSDPSVFSGSSCCGTAGRTFRPSLNLVSQNSSIARIRFQGKPKGESRVRSKVMQSRCCFS